MAEIEFTSWEFKAYIIIRELLLMKAIQKEKPLDDEYVGALKKLIEQFEEKYGEVNNDRN